MNSHRLSPIGLRQRCALFCVSIAFLASPLHADGTFAVPQISSARWHTLLLRDDGSVWVCADSVGDTYAGLLFTDPDVESAPWPVQALPPGTSTWISAGRYNSFAGVLGVGFNDYGQLGVNPAFYTSLPPSYFYSPPVSGTPVAGFEFSYYIEDGKVMAAGRNDLGQLGNGTLSPVDTPNWIFAPVLTGDGTPLTEVQMVAAGSDFGVAVKRDGTVWTWGANDYGQLGDGTLVNRYYAAPVSGLPSIVTVSASTGRYLPPPLEDSPVHDHVLALAKDGTVWAWGENRDGECGNGTPGVPVTDPVSDSDPVTVPVQVMTAPGTYLDGVTAVATGGAHSLALRRNGTVWAWGYNGSGQLGFGSYREGANSYAVRVPDLRRISSIAAGPATSFAVDKRGRAWSWGWNFNENLCQGPEADADDGFSPANFIVSPTPITNADGSPFNLKLERGKRK